MATSQKQDIKTFQNPSGYWEHRGSFSVELTKGAKKNIVPTSAKVQGNIVHVKHGSVEQMMGAIQLYSLGYPFHWGYSQMKVIRDGSGNLLWVNWDYQ